MNFKKNFITTGNWNIDELEHIIKVASKLKKNPFSRKLKNKAMCMVFFDPSLRTRTSFEIGVQQMGGYAVNLSIGKDVWNLEHREGIVMDGAASEHIKEAAKVLSRYCDVIGVRSFPNFLSWEEEKKDLVINAFAKYSDVPIINMESNMFHPCQALADMMTIKEQFKGLKGKKLVLTWANHVKQLPMAVPNSIALIASQFGMDVTICRPEGYDLDDELTSAIKKNIKANDAEFNVCSGMKKGFEGADIIYAKSWGSIRYYGKWEQEKKLRESLKDWIVDIKKMEMTNNAKFMHCLPIRRNVVATDEVIDSKNSIIYDEAENRLHAQKALLALMLDD